MKMKTSFENAGSRKWPGALVFVLCVTGIAHGQQAAAKSAAPPAPIPTPISTDDLRPAMDRLGLSVSAINVARWKAPNEVKTQAQADIASIQRNLNTTLPELLNQAQLAPTSVAPAFAVYRNVSALYDVLLRVAETAMLTGPQQDAASLDEALRRLDLARKSIGNGILDAAASRDAELSQLRASAAQMAAQAAQAPPRKVVVNDGPPATAAKKKKKPAAPPAAPPGT